MPRCGTRFVETIQPSYNINHETQSVTCETLHGGPGKRSTRHATTHLELLIPSGDERHHVLRSEVQRALHD